MVGVAVEFVSVETAVIAFLFQGGFSLILRSGVFAASRKLRAGPHGSRRRKRLPTMRGERFK
jgi:hypothetical protein